MEIHGKPGRIQISANTKTILELTEAEGYAIKSRGRISIKVLICRFLVVYLSNRGGLFSILHFNTAF